MHFLCLCILYSEALCLSLIGTVTSLMESPVQSSATSRGTNGPKHRKAHYPDDTEVHPSSTRTNEKLPSLLVHGALYNQHRWFYKCLWREHESERGQQLAINIVWAGLQEQPWASLYLPFIRRGRTLLVHWRGFGPFILLAFSSVFLTLIIPFCIFPRMAIAQ